MAVLGAVVILVVVAVAQTVTGHAKAPVDMGAQLRMPDISPLIK